jgi:hypothetical protein
MHCKMEGPCDGGAAACSRYDNLLNACVMWSSEQGQLWHVRTLQPELHNGRICAHAESFVLEKQRSGSESTFTVANG